MAQYVTTPSLGIYPEGNDQVIRMKTKQSMY